MMRRVLTCVRSERGFTLTELLMTTIVVLLGTSMVAVGVPLAVSTYGKVVDSSNAQVLLSATMTQLRDELSLEHNLSVADDVITFEDTSTISLSEATSTSENIHEGELLRDGEPFALGSVAAGKDKDSTTADSDLYVTCDGIELKGGAIVFENLCVNKEDYGTNALAGAESYAVRLLSFD